MSWLMNRRMGVGKKKDIHYIKDGLVFWLDGIDRGSDDVTKWKDLIGGMEYTVNDTVTNLHDTNAFAFDGSHYMVCNTEGDFPASTHTIEVCFQSEVSSWFGLILFKTGSYVGAWQNTSTRFHCQTGAGAPGIPYINVSDRNNPFPVTVSCFNGNFVVNGSAVASNGTDDRTTSLGGKSVIGSLASSFASYCFKGKIYSVRVYNRQLSAAEIAQNQAKDNERFHLGLTL